MKEQPVMTDERTDAVAGMGCRLAYLVLYFGVLTIAVVRALAFGQVTWDLLGLGFASSVVGLAYQHAKHAQVIPWRWMLWSALAGACMASGMAMLCHYF